MTLQNFLQNKQRNVPINHRVSKNYSSPRSRRLLSTVDQEILNSRLFRFVYRTVFPDAEDSRTDNWGYYHPCIFPFGTLFCFDFVLGKKILFLFLDFVLKRNF